MSERNLAEEEQRVLAVLSSRRFQRMKGLGREVPFFIWAYPPEWELEVAAAAGRIRTALQTEQGLTVITIDLFELAIGMLGERGVLDRLDELESRRC